MRERAAFAVLLTACVLAPQPALCGRDTEGREEPRRHEDRRQPPWFTTILQVHARGAVLPRQPIGLLQPVDVDVVGEVAQGLPGLAPRQPRDPLESR